MSQRIPALFVAESATHGRGVFCGTDISEGSLIEICPVLTVSPEDMNLLKRTSLYDYYFEWNEDAKSGAIALGFGSIYNHSTNPNARYLVDYENDDMQVIALRDIPVGEEICFNYNGDPKDKKKVWFEKDDASNQR